MYYLNEVHGFIVLCICVTILLITVAFFNTNPETYCASQKKEQETEYCKILAQNMKKDMEHKR